jgi:alpha-ketoglutarate-dependent taurine dioxygenase
VLKYLFIRHDESLGKHSLHPRCLDFRCRAAGPAIEQEAVLLRLHQAVAQLKSTRLQARTQRFMSFRQQHLQSNAKQHDFHYCFGGVFMRPLLQVNSLSTADVTRDPMADGLQRYLYWRLCTIS